MEAHSLQDTNEVNTFLPTSDNILRFVIIALFFLFFVANRIQASFFTLLILKSHNFLKNVS
jgi:hypothetical protein